MIGVYAPRYLAEPRKRKAYVIAYDLIAVYGLPRRAFDYKSLHLCRSEMKDIWEKATKDFECRSCYAHSYNGKYAD